MTEKINETTLTNAIRRTWVSDTSAVRYVIAVQVNNGAGFNYNRKLDAIVFDTWPSSGLKIHGLEIKCTKADLRKELQDTTKFSDFAPYLDTFSLVCPKGLAKLSMLPDKWGLYTLTEAGTVRASRKPLMLHIEKRKEISRGFMAAFSRALVQRSLSSAATDAAFERGRNKAEEIMSYKVKRAEGDYKELKASLKTFEEASGVRIEAWGSNKKIGEAVDFVLKGGLDLNPSYVYDIRKLGKRLIEAADEIDRLNEELK